MRAWLSCIRKQLEEGIPEVHLYRLRGVADAVAAMAQGARTTVTSIGRNLKGLKERHGIKRSDRLIGNPRLLGEREVFYGFVLSNLVKNNKAPVIHIDWTPLGNDGAFQMLTASVSVGRRAIPGYAEVHPKKKLSSRTVQHEFIDTLKRLLPSDCKPVIVGDAGFRVPFCKHVVKVGWDYVVRVRTKTRVQLPGTSEWLSSQVLRDSATSKIQDLGACHVARKNGMPARLILVKLPAKGRVEKNRHGKRSGYHHSKRHAAGGREPWLLQTSLTEAAPKHVQHLYSLRMGIEESFRDTKNVRCGAGLASSLSRSTNRLNVLAMLDAVATFFTWLFGMMAECAGLTKNYQANSVRDRRVLSRFYVGKRVASRSPFGPIRRWLGPALTALQMAVNTG